MQKVISLVLNLTTEEMGTLLGPTNRLPIQVVAVSFKPEVHMVTKPCPFLTLNDICLCCTTELD